MCEVPCFLFLKSLREVIRIFQTICKDFSSPFPATCARFNTRANFRKQLIMVKYTKITIETDSLLILRARNSRWAWCPQCAAETDVIALEGLGVITNVQRAALQEWLNSGELHRSQTVDGSELICLNSLLARAQNTKTS